MFNKAKQKKAFVLLAGVAVAVFYLTACINSSQETMKETRAETAEVKEDILAAAPDDEVVLEIPEDFLDFQKYIGENISIFGMEEGLEEYDGGTSSLYGHKGTVRVGVGWDNRTITRANLTFDDKDSFVEDYEEISDKLNKIFGETTEYDYGGIIYYSGITDFDFVLSKRSGSVSIGWNDENRKIYESKNPDAREQKPPTIQNTQRPPAIGMTAAQVRASTWGEPEDINKTTYAWGTREQWCYSGYRYIYFEDGVVTAIHE